MRAAIVMARDALDNMASEDDVTYARAALVYALAFLDASSREVGVFQDEEPFDSSLTRFRAKQRRPC